MAQISHRQRLLEGAIECLKTKGYARTTARDIASAADANLASIGYHFGSKEALLNEALIQSFEEWTEEILRRTLSEREATPLEQIATSLKLMIDSFDECRPLLVAFLESMTEAQHSPELRAQLAAFCDQLRQTIAGSVRASLGPASEQQGADPEAIASLLIAICDGLTLQWLLDPERTPDGERLAASLRAAFATALRPPATAHNR